MKSTMFYYFFIFCFFFLSFEKKGESSFPFQFPASSGESQNFLSFVPLLLMFGVVYFLVLRPQQKKIKEQQDMIAQIKKGDNVVSLSGIFGKVVDVTEKIVILEVAPQTAIKMLKSQVAQVVTDSGPERK